ncbi:MAG: transporter [Betaproteobacteria bacterium RIFCSPLOWO2_02_64_14]|nr:MAG: transporter [Betaproteobacteria bacterium RIFCSPLOWO2_02_64_14]
MRFTRTYAPYPARRAILAILVLAAAMLPPTGAAAPVTTPLQAIIREAQQNNPEIRAARSEKEAAEQRIAPAGALDDPMLEAGVISVPVDSFRFDREDMTMKMIGMSQRFPYPGKRGLRQDVAAKDAQSAGYGFQETLNRVAREAKVAYFDLALVIESARLVEKNKLILGQFLKIADGRYSVGQGSQADVLKAQTQLSKMTDELIKLGRERPMFEAELVRALGRSSDAAAPVPETLQLREAPLSFDELRERGLRERPQLLALQSVIARAEKSLELMRKESYPDFDVRFSYGQRDRMPDGTRRSDMVNLTVAINLPVWRETKVGPRIAEAQAMRDQALNMYQAQRNEVGMKLRQQVASARQNLLSARLYRNDILPQARLTVEAALAAYRVNRVDFFTLLDNQMTVYTSEIAYVNAVANYNKALAEIDLLTGQSSM